MLIKWAVTGLTVMTAGFGLFPEAGLGQTVPTGKRACTAPKSCAELAPIPLGTPPRWANPYAPVPSHPPQWIPDPMRPDATRPDPMRPDATRPDPMRPDATRPDPMRPDATRPDPMRPDPMRPDPMRPDATRPDPMTPDPMTPDTATPQITPPDTSADLTTPSDASLGFGSAQTGIGSADVAFSSAPGMIGDQFGIGNGEFGVPLILGRAILHANSVNGMQTLVGVNDFHLIDETLSPAGFQGGGGTSSQFFVAPSNFPFGTLPNGDPIPPAAVTGLQTFDLSQFGFPAGTTGLVFTATQTPDRTTVDDQTSSDVFPNAPVYVITVGDGETPLIVIPTASPSTGGVVVGRQKTSENTSPIPRDRVFMSYSYFNNTPLFPGGVDVNRFSPGFEKTFFGGNASLEARFPFATTLDSDLSVGGFTDTSHLEFGNIYLALKGLLYQSENYAFSTGLAMTLPTGDDTQVGQANGIPLVRVNNESVHLMPFLGGLYVPNDRFFAQGFLQFDFDANGNSVDLNLFGNRLTEAGVANDATYMYADVGIGYWLYRNQTRSSWLTGLAPTVELHYNRSLSDGDVIQSGFYRVGSFQDEVQNLNALIGGTAVLGDNTTLTAAYVAPIGNSSDQFFDGEARVSLNWYFGRSANAMSQYLPFSAPFAR